jgi:alpha-ketoglutarate-dependent taurine dioxygenase
VIQPDAADVDLPAWAKNNLEFLEKELQKHGAILFRGFAVHSFSEFENFASAICPELFVDYGDLPREQVSGKIYDATPYPSDRPILFHNESSHMHQWPMKQWFFCVQAPQSGGETPIVDCRKLYQRIDPKIVDGFEQKGIMYVRNFTPDLDVRWQDFFKTDDRAAVGTYCKNASMEMSWRDGNRLRIRHVSRGVTKHPKTGEMVWFNQAQLWHLACLDAVTRDSLLALFGEEDLPRNCYYGDGSRIEDSVIDHIGDVYRTTAAAFPWHARDILMMDNMLVAHSRNPYQGPRRIVVAMAEMMKFS